MLVDERLTTPIVHTGKGRHVYLRHPGGVLRNFARKRPGLDFRGDGGYVIAPPSVHPSGRAYAFCDGLGPDRALADPPRTIMALMEPGPPAERSRDVMEFSRAPSSGAAAPVDRYVASAIEREVGRVVAASEGQRNSTLNEAAFNLAGQLVGAGVLGRANAEGLLISAAKRCGLSEIEASRTVESGLTAGTAKPRDLSSIGPDASHVRAAALTGRDAAPPVAAPDPLADVAALRLDRLTAGAAPRGAGW